MCVALFSCCKPKQDNSVGGGAGTEPEIPVEQPWHDMTDKFERISDDELLTLVQKHAFGYFYDYAHPVSGLARERLGSGDTVTSGGSGFGIGAIPVAVERGFISRKEGYSHLRKIVDFLSAESTERFHGAWPHWLNGSTGKAIAFSPKDNGADLVETAFLVQGLLISRAYFMKDASDAEKKLCDDIEKLYEEVEWSWFERNDALYWHWSQDYGWEMNMKITGWNEGLIVYVLAASSPTYPIKTETYDKGWAREGAMRNGNKFYDVVLPLGEAKGGPLFFSHYSFLGLDPRNLSDRYASYWEQNCAHAKINYLHCVNNPRMHTGYSADCWGLTASDIPNGYTASSPTNDVGVIAPTAAVSSLPYTPDESMAAIRFFYYILGDSLWGQYGFRDSFKPSSKWFASSYLAIDQGPEIIMIENYRTGLCWNLFMSDENIRGGLTRLGFTY